MKPGGRALAGGWGPAIGLGVALAGVAVGVGALLGFAGPILGVAALLAAAAGLWALTSLEVGLWGVIAIITLLPFAALPVKVVFTPTFLDLAIGVVFFVYALHWMTGRRRRVALTPAHAPILLFVALAVFCFVAGLNNGPLTSNLLRQFAELLLNILLSLLLVDYLDDWDKAAGLARVVVLCGAAAAALGLVLYLLPDAVADRLLSALRVVGYPSGGVLRYIEDDPSQAERAISTSVDPNFFGGLLAMVGGLLAPQLLSRRPLLGSRLLTLLAFCVVLACLVLTYSRGAMAGLALGVAGIALLRYRRLIWVMLLAAALVLVLPMTREYVTRFIEGVQGQDLATQMRFGEYKDAFILISRYPLLGVGFAGAPQIDIYLGVSSAYLLMAEQMGLVGITAFALLLAVLFGWAFRQRRYVYAVDMTPTGVDAPALWLGAHAGLVAALAVGVLDHYFFQMSFQSAGTLFWLYVGLCLAATRLGVPRPAAAQSG
ncbi:MAG: O-antigen ligase family protein [Anaerolineales bacterium]|nr:O-antigen ligase family protein [Anaerolineales bacterium]